MSKPISELVEVTSVGPDDLIEVAIVDGESSTGYSSRSVAIGNLPGGAGGDGLCRFNITDTYSVTDNQFIIDIPFDDLASCLLGWPFNQLASASVHMQMTVFTTNFNTPLGSSVSDIVINESTYSTMRFIGSQGTGNSTPDVLPYTPAQSDPPPFNVAPIVFDAYQYQDEGDDVRMLRIVVELSTTLTYTDVDVVVVGFLDFTGVGYNPA